MFFLFKKLHRPLKAVICGWLVLFLVIGTVRPTFSFTVGEEKEVGEELLAIVRKEFKVIDDPDVVQYVNRVGGQILHAAGPQFFDYHFFVIDNKEFNAFAAPSGMIFIHSGLIKTMDSEGELVSVIAHEVGHAASRHIADRIAKSSKINAGTAAMALAGILLGAGPVSEALIVGSLATGTTMNLKFSRQDEEEADRLAYKYMKQLGRNPASMVSMLRKMYRIDRYRQGQVPAYLLTHPQPSMRMGYVQNLVQMDGAGKYASEDQFDFRRIKCRILAQSDDSLTLLPVYQRESVDVELDADRRMMALYGVSLAQAASADFDAAIKSLKRVISFYPDKPILQTDLGVIYFAQGNIEKALAIFKKSFAAAPDCFHTKYYLARTLYRSGKLKEAAILYEELLVQMPDNADLHSQLGRIKAELGNLASGYYHLGVSFWYQGNAEMAKRHLKQAIELSKDGGEKKAAKELLKTIARVEKNSK